MVNTIYLHLLPQLPCSNYGTYSVYLHLLLLPYSNYGNKNYQNESLFRRLYLHRLSYHLLLSLLTNPNSVAAKVILPANFEDRLILIFLNSVDLELMKNARSPKIWAP